MDAEAVKAEAIKRLKRDQEGEGAPIRKKEVVSLTTAPPPHPALLQATVHSCVCSNRRDANAGCGNAHLHVCKPRLICSQRSAVGEGPAGRTPRPWTSSAATCALR